MNPVCHTCDESLKRTPDGWAHEDGSSDHVALPVFGFEEKKRRRKWETIR